MNRTITFDYSPRIVRKAAKHFLFRYYRKMMLLAGVVLALGLVLVLSRYGGWLGYLAVLAPFAIPVAWSNYVNTAVKAAQELRDSGVSVTLTDESITFETSQHCCRMNWSLLKDVWRFPDVWLLFTYSVMSYVLIPTEALDEELRSFIETRVGEEGGKVS